jgi:hypothetical protein
MVSLLLVVVGLIDPALLTPQPQVMPSTTVQELVLVDGTRLIGVVEQAVNGVIVLRGATGNRRQVDASQVVSVHTGTSATPSSASEIRVPWRDDVSRTRLLIGPTARALERGEVYIDDLSVFFPSVQVGLTNQVSIGAGTPLLVPQADVHPGEVVWITPKVQLFSGRRTQGAVGLMHVVGKGANGGLAYGVVTHGTTNTAFTIGAGTAYPTHGGARAVTLVGAERRVSPRVKLLTENYLSAEGTLFTGGVRVLGRKRTLDIAWFKFPGAAFYPIPLLRMTFHVSGRDR